MPLYNNGFPATYQNPYMQQYQYPQMQQPTPQQAPQTNSNLIWVQGEAGAKSYLVAPNTTVQLWDSEKQCIYLKSADASGMPSMKVLDYTIRDNAPSNAPAVASAASESQMQYATKAELETLYGQISGLKSKIEKLTEKRKKVDDDE